MRTCHEIARRKTLDRGRRPQNQRQPRRGVLERHEGNLGTSRHDVVRAGRRDRHQSPARQPVVRDPPLRAGLFPKPRHLPDTGFKAVRLAAYSQASGLRPRCAISRGYCFSIFVMVLTPPISSAVKVTLSPSRKALNNSPSCTLNSSEVPLALAPTVPL